MCKSCGTNIHMVNSALFSARISSQSDKVWAIRCGGVQVAYSIDAAFSDSAIAFQTGDPGAFQRLETFVAELTEEQIKDNYLALAKLFWSLPYGESVQLAHVVIERYLSQNDLWADIYLWGFSALRQVPKKDTVWTTRNYLAASLQALGQPERAREILDENWRSFQAGSSLAWEWLTGEDMSKSVVQRYFDAASGKPEEKEENQFLKFRADWLDLEKVESVKSRVFTRLSEDMKGEEFKVLRSFIDSDQGLTSYVLEMVDRLSTEKGVERDNTLFGITLATLAFLKLDDSEYLVGEAAKAEMRGDDATVAVDYLSIAAFLMNPAAYVPLSKILKSIGLVEQATGYANVAVSKNIRGSADVLISLLGLDGVQLDAAGVEMSEEEKVSAYKLFGGWH